MKYTLKLVSIFTLFLSGCSIRAGCIDDVCAKWKNETDHSIITVYSIVDKKKAKIITPRYSYVDIVLSDNRLILVGGEGYNISSDGFIVSTKLSESDSIALFGPNYTKICCVYENSVSGFKINMQDGKYSTL